MLTEKMKRYKTKWLNLLIITVGTKEYMNSKIICSIEIYKVG